MIMTSRLIKRSFCGKLWYIDFHFPIIPSLIIIVWRQLGNQEGKLFSHINSYKEFFSEISCAVCVRENNLYNLAGAAQGGRPYYYRCQRKVLINFFKSLSI